MFIHTVWDQKTYEILLLWAISSRIRQVRIHFTKLTTWHEFKSHLINGTTLSVPSQLAYFFFAHNAQFITPPWYATNTRKLFLEIIPARFTMQILPLDWQCIQHVNEQFVSCIHFFSAHSFFIKPHKQKSNEVKSGDLGGQLMVLPRPIHLLGKVSLRCCITCRV